METINPKETVMQGSVINRIMEHSTGEPCVGLPVTFCYYSDRRAGIIVDVAPNGRWFETVTVQATRIDTNGMSESQRYEYSMDPDQINANRTRWTLRRNGTFRQAGEPMRGGTGIVLGIWDAYYDYSF